jgi:hypothetical protein
MRCLQSSLYLCIIYMFNEKDGFLLMRQSYSNILLLLFWQTEFRQVVPILHLKLDLPISSMSAGTTAEPVLWLKFPQRKIATPFKVLVRRHIAKQESPHGFCQSLLVAMIVKPRVVMR